LNTQLVDNTFPEDDFEVVLGSLEVKWQRIGPYLLCVAVLSCLCLSVVKTIVACVVPIMQWP